MPLSDRTIVNDVSVRQEFDTGYKLVAVDGQPVERAHGNGLDSVAPYVPVARIPPGTHSLTLRRSGGENAESRVEAREVTITATLQSDMRYRFANDGGEVRLVEDFNAGL